MADQDLPMMSPPNNGPYGAEILPLGPLQDMEASFDLIAGEVEDRTASPAEFGAGTGGGGLGGVAMPDEPPALKVP